MEKLEESFIKTLNHFRTQYNYSYAKLCLQKQTEKEKTQKNEYAQLSEIAGGRG